MALECEKDCSINCKNKENIKLCKDCCYHISCGKKIFMVCCPKGNKFACKNFKEKQRR